MKTLLFIPALLLLHVFVPLAIAEEMEEFPNPHWAEDEKLCLECHEIVPRRGSGILNLKFNGEIITLCMRCHASLSKDKSIHATGMVPSKEMIERMPENFKGALKKDKLGRITCYACHVMAEQCLSEYFDRREKNPRFHRGGPYEKRTDLCYNCHDKSKYKKFNPHDMINDEGELRTDICTYCHDIMPDRRKAKSIKDVTFKMKRYDMLCLRCHSDDAYAVGCVTGFEEDGSPIFHTGKPQKDMVEKIRSSEKEKDAILPLALVTGNIFCGTCHNPHELGVQRRHQADVGADSHKRLRISRQNSRLCLGCHSAKEVKAFENK